MEEMFSFFLLSLRVCVSVCENGSCLFVSFVFEQRTGRTKFQCGGENIVFVRFAVVFSFTRKNHFF